ncbi:MAG: hypothetical protein KKG47_11930 [Proteobacteria bacterium]|nr:hypothetical protein [Pseudomonadota bacterium]MBU1737830.1 hypothetical protein [Pseudomonadota bacterium]
MSTPLRKTIVATCLVIFVFLTALLTLWFRQNQTIRQQQNVVEQTEKINFQFAIIREHITESILDRKFDKFPEIAVEMEELNQNISRVIANAHIPDEYKLSLMNQIDIPGIILLLRQIETDNQKPESLKRLNRDTRVLGERLILFDRMTIDYARRAIFALQSIIIGTLALSVFTLVIVLALLYRRMAVPIMSLARQTTSLKEGKNTSLSMPSGCAETDVLASFTKDLLDSRENDKAEIFRASQLAALGELAADVAHEINNLSNGVINYAQILADEDLNDRQSPEHDLLVGKIIKEGERIAGISGKLLSYSECHAKGLEPIDLNRLVEETLALTQHRFRSDGIEIIRKLQPDLPEFAGNAQHIKHLLLNLLNNARYALNLRYPAKDDNKILEVESEITFDKDEKYVRVAITDLGPGIPPQTLKHVFEPNFSTKPRGTGSGLGLSISREIAREHNGEICIDSEVGDHTTVKVDFPVN